MLDFLSITPERQHLILRSLLECAWATPEHKNYLSHAGMVAPTNKYVMHRICNDPLLSTFLGLTIGNKRDIVLDGCNYLTQPSQVLNPKGLSHFLFLPYNSMFFLKSDECPASQLTQVGPKEIFLHRIAFVMILVETGSDLLSKNAAGILRLQSSCYWDLVEDKIAQVMGQKNIITLDIHSAPDA